MTSLPAAGMMTWPEQNLNLPYCSDPEQAEKMIAYIHALKILYLAMPSFMISSHFWTISIEYMCYLSQYDNITIWQYDNMTIWQYDIYVRTPMNTGVYTGHFLWLTKCQGRCQEPILRLLNLLLCTYNASMVCSRLCRALFHDNTFVLKTQ
jgi:hypothetical protein